MTVVCAGLVLLGSRLAGATQPAPPPSDGQPESLNVRYARTQVELVEASLKKIEATNKRVNREVSADVTYAYQQDLDVAKLQLQVALGGGPKNSFDVWLRRAENAAAYAEALWRGAAAANRRAAGAVDPLEIERLRLVFDLTRLELEQGRAVAHASTEDKLQWQLDFVNSQIERAMDEMRQSTRNGSSVPPPVASYPGTFAASGSRLSPRFGQSISAP
jgi:hypothetical protein